MMKCHFSKSVPLPNYIQLYLRNINRLLRVDATASQLIHIYIICPRDYHISCSPTRPLSPLQNNDQGTYSVHYSLYFIVYNILFTICTLLKLYTIGHVAGSGKKYKGYRFKTSQLSTKKTWSNSQPYPGLKKTRSQAGRCARHKTSNQV